MHDLHPGKRVLLQEAGKTLPVHASALGAAVQPFPPEADDRSPTSGLRIIAISLMKLSMPAQDITRRCRERIPSPFQGQHAMITCWQIHIFHVGSRRMNALHAGFIALFRRGVVYRYPAANSHRLQTG
jgi:hypothetical protein